MVNSKTNKQKKKIFMNSKEFAYFGTKLKPYSIHMDFWNHELMSNIIHNDRSLAIK